MNHPDLFLGIALLLVAQGGLWATQEVPIESSSTSLVLITLDTTRADYIGAYGSRAAETPHLDALAERGTRYAHAFSPSPLTLPSHASLLTGLLPPEHGVRDNGISALSKDLPTLATRLGEHGYETAAFVGSRVLDHRFGLDRGFDVYDDRMAAERIGEYGYPERDAAAVTSAARSWLAERDAKKPFFLWVHYYDPHLPYAPPGGGGSSVESSYAGEIAFADEQIGMLLSDLSDRASDLLVVAVGDHGESLGEHGERSHGLFLYSSSLRVPLIIAGPAVPVGRIIDEKVATARLAATLLHLLVVEPSDSLPGRLLPGLDEKERPGQPIYSETRMPSTVYGWSSLRSISDQRWRLVVAPRPELYDTETDEHELVNLYGEHREIARRLARTLKDLEKSFVRREASTPENPAELGAALRSLGYLSGSASQREGDIDPKDGLAWLEELRQAKKLLNQGHHAEALERLEGLNRRSPDNVPFLANLARAQELNGQMQESIATLERSLMLNPELDFLHLDMGAIQRRLGNLKDAKGAYETALELNPRSAKASLSLAEIAHHEGRAADERAILQRAEDSGTASISILSRLAELEYLGGEPKAADETLRRSIELAPEVARTWISWGDVATAMSRPQEAKARFERAAEIEPTSPLPPLKLGKLAIEEQNIELARTQLQLALTLGRGGPRAQEARRLLASLPTE